MDWQPFFCLPQLIKVMELVAIGPAETAVFLLSRPLPHERPGGVRREATASCTRGGLHRQNFSTWGAFSGFVPLGHEIGDRSQELSGGWHFCSLCKRLEIFMELGSFWLQEREQLESELQSMGLMAHEVERPAVGLGPWSNHTMLLSLSGGLRRSERFMTKQLRCVRHAEVLEQGA